MTRRLSYAALGVMALAFIHAACGGPSHARPGRRGSDARVHTTTPEKTPETNQAASDSVRAIEPLIVEASRARDLRFSRKVPIRVESEREITRHLADELKDDDLVRARAAYETLGLLEPGVDVRKLLMGVLGEQVIGYYDPRGEKLVVRTDVLSDLTVGPSSTSGRRGESEVVLVHELVHALQDQNLGLGSKMDEKRDSDVENAFRAVVEGDATLAMLSYMARRFGIDLNALTARPEVLREAGMNTSNLAGGKALAEAPAIVRKPLLSAYFDGLVFCAALFREGGWKQIDAAHRALPVSTEQILHPERYLRGERPEAIARSQLPTLTAAGYATFHDDSLGELETRIFFEQASSDSASARAADGWAGDRLAIYQRKGAPDALVWFTLWDSPPDGEEAEHAAQRVAALARFRTPSRPWLVRRKGRAVLIARGLPQTAVAFVSQVFEHWADAVASPAKRLEKAVPAPTPLTPR